MNPELAKVIIVAIIGGTVIVSLISAAVVRLAAQRRGSGADERIEARLQRIEQAIDAMATEVERVAEGQRFTSRLLADREQQRT